MRFFTPESELHAVSLLAERADYRCLAGGGLIVPGFRSGPRPEGLISLRRLDSLRGFSSQRAGMRIGAMTTHTDVIGSHILSGGNALVRRAAREIAHPVVRNMATIGGTLCRADPSADYCCALLAADARVQLKSSRREREIAVDDFIIGDGITAREADELLVSVTLPLDQGLGTSGYARFSRVDGDYPAVTAAVRLAWAGGAISSARLAIGGCGPRAYRSAEAERLLIGVYAIEQVPKEIYELLVAAARPISDLKGSADFRRLLIPGLMRRALAQALAPADTMQ